MDMSSACTAPIQPTLTATDMAHPRFADYQIYRSAMIRQMVTGLSFSAWLEKTMENENGREVVFHTLPGAQLAQGWYKHLFAPGSGKMTRFGPFDTEGEAKSNTTRWPGVYKTGRAYKGLDVLHNVAIGRECVAFGDSLYSLSVIDEVRAEAVREAAPDMLAALRLVWNSIDRVNHPAAETVRAAIAKAERQEP